MKSLPEGISPRELACGAGGADAGGADKEDGRAGSDGAEDCINGDLCWPWFDTRDRWPNGLLSIICNLELIGGISTTAVIILVYCCDLIIYFSTHNMWI